jgi:hypothetical protein
MSIVRAQRRMIRPTRPADVPPRGRNAGARLTAFSRPPVSSERQTAPLSHDDDVFDLLRIESDAA